MVEFQKHKFYISIYSDIIIFIVDKEQPVVSTGTGIPYAHHIGSLPVEGVDINAFKGQKFDKVHRGICVKLSERNFDQRLKVGQSYLWRRHNFVDYTGDLDPYMRSLLREVKLRRICSESAKQ